CAAGSKYAPDMVKLLSDSDSYVRDSAAEALGKMGAAGSKFAPDMVKLLSDSDRYVRDSAAYALGNIGAADSKFAPDIVKLLSDSDRYVRDSAAEALGKMGAAGSKFAPDMVKLLSHSDSDVRSRAAYALGKMGAAGSKFAPDMVKLLSHSDGNVRFRAAEALGNIGAAGSKFAPDIVKLLSDSDSRVRFRAAYALGKMGAAGSKFAPDIVKLLSDSDWRVRFHAAEALGKMGAAGSKFAPDMVKLLSDSDSRVRDRAARTLGNIGAADSKFAPDMVKLLNHSDRPVRYSAAEALGEMGQLEIKDLLAVLNEVYRCYQGEAPILRFLSYLLSSGEKDSLLLIKWLGLPKKYPDEISPLNRQEGEKVLQLFAKVWKPSQSLDMLGNDLEEQIAVVVNQVNWKPADIPLLKEHYQNLKQADSRLAAVVNSKIIALEGKQWFFIFFKLWLAHLSLWLILITAYPHSRQVQTLIWNRKTRQLFGLGYIGIALTAIPFLRYRLLAPFSKILLADANLDSFDTQAYFPNSHIQIKRAIHTQPIQTVISQLQSPIVLEGESGLGKSIFLRNLVKTSGRLAVYLPASKCTAGVIEAIQAKLPISAHDSKFLQSLIDYNTLDICIDGLNEVTPDTRATISSFVERHFQGHIIITTQP
ncbi:MAG: HEAT repeat domain-containing protein, partial [Symploca sp. SIO1C4]|nr:HEAT repeat domain-containing protein [Symploca sp. SIO1C4]